MQQLRAVSQASAAVAVLLSLACAPPKTPDYDIPDAAPPDDAPYVVSAIPVDGSENVNRRPVIRIEFNRQLDARTLQTYVLNLHSGETGRWLISYYDPILKQIVVWPSGHLLRQSTWVFELKKGLTAPDGVPVTPGRVTSFRTGDDIIFETPYRVRPYKDEIAPLFKAHCVSCHGGSQALAGLKLDTEQNIADTAIDRSSLGRPDWDIIVPTQPGLSYLLYKLIDDGNTPGMMMPRTIDDTETPSPLTLEEKEILVDWITLGAVFFDPEDTEQ